MWLSSHFSALCLTGHLYPPVCDWQQLLLPCVRPPIIHPCVSARPVLSSLCLLSVFALPVYSRLRSLLGIAFMSTAYTRDVTSSRTLHFSHCRTPLCGSHNYFLCSSWHVAHLHHVIDFQASNLNDDWVMPLFYSGQSSQVQSEMRPQNRTHYLFLHTISNSRFNYRCVVQRCVIWPPDSFAQ